MKVMHHCQGNIQMHAMGSGLNFHYRELTFTAIVSNTVMVINVNLKKKCKRINLKCVYPLNTRQSGKMWWIIFITIYKQVKHQLEKRTIALLWMSKAMFHKKKHTWKFHFYHRNNQQTILIDNYYILPVL